jgi:hypothetical protein
MTYSTVQSVRHLWGALDTSALLQGDDNSEVSVRFARAAQIASATVDLALRGGGYALPLPVLAYQEVPPLIPDGRVPLDSLLQQASDCLTVYYLAHNHNLMREEFEKCFDDQTIFLRDVKNRKVVLDYKQEVNSLQQVVVIARESILDAKSFKGCCGRTLYR